MEKIFTTVNAALEHANSFNKSQHFATTFFLDVELAQSLAEALGLELRGDKIPDTPKLNAFNVEGVCEELQLARIVYYRDEREEETIYINNVYNVVKYGGEFYHTFKNREGRYSLDRVNRTPAKWVRFEDKKPKYFSKPTAKTVRAWVDWAEAKEAAAVKEKEECENNVAFVQATAEAHGLQVEPFRLEQRVINGPVEAYFTPYSKHPRFEINRFYWKGDDVAEKFMGSKFLSAEEYAELTAAAATAEAAKSELAKLREEVATLRVEAAAAETQQTQPQTQQTQPQTQPTAEEPQPEDERAALYRIFKAITIEGDTVKTWSETACRILDAVAANAEGIAADICRRVIRKPCELSYKQRWCITYAYARLS